MLTQITTLTLIKLKFKRGNLIYLLDDCLMGKCLLNIENSSKLSLLLSTQNVGVWMEAITIL